MCLLGVGGGGEGAGRGRGGDEWAGKSEFSLKHMRSFWQVEI